MTDRPLLADPQPLARDFSGLEDLSQARSEGALVPMGAGTSISTPGMALTMQPCQVKRSLREVYNELRELCRINGNDYYYSWEVKNRREGTVDTIEGPTIKLANDLARAYGNCWYGVIDVVESPTHWYFKALFIDLEKGVNVSRPFRQRKSQDTGMRDRDRQEDIVFQIAASKAIRNVVCNALGTLSDFMLEESKKALTDWVEKHGDKAREWIVARAKQYGLTEARVSSIIGRPAKEWTTRDLAKVMVRFKAIEDGSARISDVFPTEEDAAVVTAAKQQQAAKETKEPKAQPKPRNPDPAAPASAQAAAGTTAGPSASTPPSEDAASQKAQAQPSTPAPATSQPSASKPAKKKAAPAPQPEPQPEPEPEPEDQQPDDQQGPPPSDSPPFDFDFQ